MSLSLNGSSGVASGSLTAMDTGDWTIAARVKPLSAGEGSAGHVVHIDPASANYRQLVRMNAGIRTLRVDQRFATTISSTITTTVIPLAWSIVVATFRASDAKCRVFLGDLLTVMAEASYASQTAGVGTRQTGATTMRIGNDSADGKTWDGLIEDVIVEPREWSLAEMDRYRMGWRPVMLSSVRGWWPLADGSGLAKDRGQGAKHLTVTTAVAGALAPRLVRAA